MTLRSPRTPLLAVLLAALALSAPAAARADSVVLGAADTRHGYDLTVLGDTGHDLVTVMLTHDRGRVTQEHLYTFSDVAVGADRIRGDLGRLGTIDLRFREGSGGGLPPGCHGRVLDEGTWSGQLRLRADDDFFGTIREDRLSGAVLAGRKAECDEPGEADDEVHGLLLQATTRRISVVAEGGIAHVLVQEERGGASVMHLASAPARMDADRDLSAATVTARENPLITGALDFTGSRRAATDDDGPVGDTAVGSVTGDLTAHFDSIGDVALPENAEALLERIG